MKANGVLQPGVQTKLGDLEVTVAADYTKEVDAFLKGEKDERRFLGLDNEFKSMLRVLTTDLPYVAFVSDPGTGKSLMIDEVIDVMTNKVSPAKLEKLHPGTINLSKLILERASTFERLDYILLPNMLSPKEPTVLSYSSKTQAINDKEVAESFLLNLSNYFNQYALQNREHIRTELPKDDFQSWTKASLEKLYLRLYDNLKNDFTLAKSNDKGYVLNIKLDFGSRISKRGKLKSTVDITRVDGKPVSGSDLISFSGLKAGQAQDMTYQKKNMQLNSIPNKIMKDVAKFLQEFYTLDVSNGKKYLSTTEKESYLKDKLKEVSQERSELIEQGMAEEAIESTSHVSKYLSKHTSSYQPLERLSNTSLEHLIQGAELIVDNFSKKQGSEKLNSWMTSTVKSYFGFAKTDLELSLKNMLQEIKRVEEQKLDEVNVLNKALQGKTKRTRVKKEDEVEKNRKIYQDIKFGLSHGGHTMKVEDIFTVNYLSNKGDATGYTWSQISGGLKDMFASFNNVGKETPPHQGIEGLGPFFEGGVIIFRDALRDFVQYIHEKRDEGMKEKFLDYLQSKQMIVTHDDGGINYKFFAPKIILANDNSYPFISITDGIVQEEVGLADRFTTMYLTGVKRNSPTNRKNMMEVIQRKLDEQNKVYKFSKENSITIQEDAYDALVGAHLVSGGTMIWSQYRNVRKYVGDLVGYAFEKGKKTIDLKVMREKLKTDTGEFLFRAVDQDGMSFDGYFSEVDEVGAMNGLSIGRDNSMARMIAEHHISPGRRRTSENDGGELFVYSDMEAELGGKMAIKGYDQASEYVRLLLEELAREDRGANWRKGDWYIKSQKRGNWHEFDGPSSGAVLTVSMLSELSGDKIYKNRFGTGTINAKDGRVGPIGGVYHKGLAGLRLKQLYQEEAQNSVYAKHLKEKNIDFVPHFLFPTTNLSELTTMMKFDAFGLSDGVISLPVQTIEQYYYLATVDPILTQDSWDNIQENSLDHFSDMKTKIKDRIKELNSSYQDYLSK